jgi:hypothetical protein
LHLFTELNADVGKQEKRMNHNRLAPLGGPSIRSSISLSLSINSSKELIVSEEGWVVRVFFVYVGSWGNPFYYGREISRHVVSLYVTTVEIEHPFEQ